MAQRFLRAATKKNREQDQENDRGLARESSMEWLRNEIAKYVDSDLRLWNSTPTRNRQQEK
jgi:hypothetical protein